MPFYSQGQQIRCKLQVASKWPHIFYLKFLLVVWTLFQRKVPKGLSQLIAFLPKSTMAKQQNRQEFGPFKTVFSTISRNKASEKQNTHYNKNLEIFDKKKQGISSINCMTFNCHPQNHQNLISWHGGYFSRFCLVLLTQTQTL